jgi:predicted permease
MARIRYAIRSLAKAPLLSLVVIFSLALGIGANTGIFSLLHQIVLGTLPVQRPEELVVLTSPGDLKNGRNSTSDSGGIEYVFNYRTLRELERQTAAVTAVAGFRNLGANLAFGNQTVNAQLLVVSGHYFPTLGVQPMMGRLLAPEDDAGAGNPVAVLGYGYWHDRLGAETGVLNRPIRINGQVFTIVGVAPRNFSGTTLGEEPAAFLPMALKPQLTPGWNGTDKLNDYWIYLFARLKPGVTRQQAEAALNGPFRAVIEEQAKTAEMGPPGFRERFLKSRLTLRDGSQGTSAMREGSRVPLLILMTATGLVLLIAIANAANLLLARSAQRRRELAIRAAMGAGRGELMSRLLTEALLLALAGGVAGVFLGAATVRLLMSQMSDGVPIYFLSAQLERPVLLFALGLSLLTGLLFGLYPAWEAARASLAGTLKGESGQSTSTRGSARVRRALVCAQVTISAVLLIPTGLFLKSLVNLMHVDLGIRTENVIGFSISPQLNGYNWEQCRSMLERAETQLAAIPGVRGVATSMVPLIGGSNWGHGVSVDGVSYDPHADTFSNFNEVGPGFFGKMGIPLIAGREFTEADTLAGGKVGIVNEQFVKHFFGNQNPIGRRYVEGVGPRTRPDIEIVGVVKDSHYSGVKQTPPRIDYRPWRQDRQIGFLSFYVRSALPVDAAVPQIRRVMAGLDRNLPLEDLRTLDDQVRRNVRNDRLVLQLAAAFAALATVLAMLGLYGVMAQSVTRRTREIGIRMALGAGPRRILGMVMREMLWILGIGLATGVPLALLLARYTESQLFGVKAFDALVLAGAVLALTAAAAAAGYLPAHRAARVDPVDALHYD